MGSAVDASPATSRPMLGHGPEWRSDDEPTTATKEPGPMVRTCSESSSMNASTRECSSINTTSPGISVSSDNRGPTENLYECSGSCKAPEPLYSAFDPVEVRSWEPERFQMLEKVQEAPRNRGQVFKMRDTFSGRIVAVKRMPNDWVCASHEDFVGKHPFETEQPWQDIGCQTFLNKIDYPFSCKLLGVFRDSESTSIVTEFASEGDMFKWCGISPAPGPSREALVRPLAIQIMEAVRRLHDLSIVHCDLSLENILVSTQGVDGPLQIQIIDFGMASTGRCFRRRLRGKPSYQAPEIHTESEYDGFLADAFAVGVALYAALMQDYPWMSTKSGGCRCFDYVQKHGFRAFIAKRKLRGVGGTVADHMSEPLIQLLEGLLALDPTKRLTLGEATWDQAGGRKSVWQQKWASDCPAGDTSNV